MSDTSATMSELVNREGLTPRQRDLLGVILLSVQERGYSPTFREMAEAMGIRSTNGVNDHLQALVKKGVVALEGGRSRIRVVGLRWVPVRAEEDRT